MRQLDAAASAALEGGELEAAASVPLKGGSWRRQLAQL